MSFQNREKEEGESGVVAGGGGGSDVDDRGEIANVIDTMTQCEM
jgi:hypothetical protein